MDTDQLINEGVAKSMTFALKTARTKDPEKMDKMMAAIDLVDEIADAIVDEEVTPEEAGKILARMKEGGAIVTFMKTLMKEVGITL